MTRRLVAGLALAAVYGLGMGVAQADISRVVGMCANCHGDDGISFEPEYPTIAGLPVDIQRDALVAYRDGKRDCGPVPMMCKAAAKLTDEQIGELAEHFAAMEFQPAEQEFDADLAAKGKILHEDFCQVCHGDSPEHADKSILHGQWADYLRYAMEQYASGHREQPPSMRKATEKLSEEDLEALVNYYASYGQ